MSPPYCPTPKFSLREQLVAVAQEVNMRRSVYRRSVNTGSMRLSEAERKIAVMEAVADTLRALIKAEEEKAAPELPL